MVVVVTIFTVISSPDHHVINASGLLSPIWGHHLMEGPELDIHGVDTPVHMQGMSNL